MSSADCRTPIGATVRAQEGSHRSARWYQTSGFGGDFQVWRKPGGTPV
ncbi:hypothetical protein [Actinocorallia populi]|nr:hypothetical protein [Actinocorallia populi]